MSEEARQYLRAAQDAEIRGDKAQAVELLMKAAAVYRSNGQDGRALQMLRHANRLDPERQDIREEVRRLEWVPDRPLARAVEPDDDSEEETALAPLDELAEQPKEKRLIERGPTRADPQLNAWCSFCCRPRVEVGDLVAGPAGAFVCLHCIRESAKILGWNGPEPVAFDSGPSTGSGRTGSPAGRPEQSEAESKGQSPTGGDTSPVAAVDADADRPEVSANELVGQDDAAIALDSAMRMGLRCVLIVGPKGSGKTTCLLELERKGLGLYAPTPSGVGDASGGTRLLVDNLDQATPAELAALRRLLETPGERRVVLAINGVPGPAPLVLKGEGAELPVYPTQALVEATQGALPAEIAEHVQAVAVLRSLDAAALAAIGRRMLAARTADLDASEELIQALAEEAARSGRGGHELRALVGRIPSGDWTVKSQPPREGGEKEPARASGKKKRGKKKDAAEPA